MGPTEAKVPLFGVVGGGRPNTLLSRLIGLIIAVTLEMARFIRFGVRFSEKTRLTRLPNLENQGHIS